MMRYCPRAKRPRLTRSSSCNANASFDASYQTSSLLMMPNDILVLIFKQLKLVDLIRCQRVSKRFGYVIEKNLVSLKRPLNLAISYFKSFRTKAKEFFMVLCGGKGAEIWELEIFKANADDAEVDDHEDFIHCISKMQAPDTDGVATLMTTRTVNQILTFLFKKLEPYCHIDTVHIDCQKGNEKHFGPLRIFQNVKEIKLKNVPWKNVGKELKYLPELEKLYVESKIAEKDFDLQSLPAMRELIVVAKHEKNFTAVLDDEVLLEKRDLGKLEMWWVRNEVTLQGMRAVISEWMEGKRDITDILLQPSGTKMMAYESVVKFLHEECSTECSKAEGIHALLRPTDDARLELCIIPNQEDWDYDVRLTKAKLARIEN